MTKSNITKYSTTVYTPEVLTYIRTVSAIPFLTPSEEQTITEEWKTGLSKQSFKRVVESHLTLVVKMASKMKDRKSTRLNSSHSAKSRMPSSA